MLEDLNELGYELANRKQRLDVERTKKLLCKLAQFHATTAVLYSKVSNSNKIETTKTLIFRLL